MNLKTVSLTPLRSALAVVIALALASAVHAQSSDKPHGKPMAGKPMAGKMMASCEELMDQKYKMMAAATAQDVELTAQVARMNSASADEKSTAMGAIVTSLVEQRTAQNVQAGKMHEKMMAHMMGHMEMGKDSASGCPMMKSTGDLSEKSSGSSSQEYRADRK